MSTMSSIGVGSNLPLNDLLTNLRNNENVALKLIQNRQITAQTKVSAYGKLKDAVAALQTAAQAVGKADAFGALKTDTASQAFSAAAANTAIAGQYAIQVDALARAQTLVAGGRTERDTAIGAGGSITVTLANGDAHTVALGAGDTSLNGLVAALNGDPDSGVNATLVNDGSGTPHRLLLTSRTTGTDAAVTSIAVSGNADLAAFLDYDAGGNTANYTVQAAANAQLSINSIPVTSQTNSISDAIEGVTLTLKETTTAPAQLKIARDDASATKAISHFIDAYNGLLGTIKSLTAYDTAAQAAEPLMGDSLAQRVKNTMRDALSGALGGIDGLSLSRIGITTDPKTGELAKDEKKLATALKDNLQGVTSLFTGTSGAGTRVAAAAEAFTRTDGLISSTTASLSRTMEQMQKQYDATFDRIEQRMETYRKQFVQLDTMVAQMNSLSSYLTQQLGMLGNMNQANK